jgi:DNA-binding NtrC family response regulator
VTAGLTTFPAAGALRSGLDEPPVAIFERRPDRAVLTNGEAKKGWAEIAPTNRDRVSPLHSPTESNLWLAGIPLAELEKRAIIQTLQNFDGNRTKAARALGISVRTLQRKLRIWRNARPPNTCTGRANMEESD